jgi:hypothetical protein
MAQTAELVELEGIRYELGVMVEERRQGRFLAADLQRYTALILREAELLRFICAA